MAGNRIRSVRPELLEHPRFAALSDGAVRLWMGLLPCWDDEGRSLGSVGYVKGRVYFARRKSNALIGREIAELEAAGWLFRYGSAGVEYLAVRGWSDPKSECYQFIKDARPSKLPAPTIEPRTEHRTEPRSTPRTEPRTLDQDQDQDGDQDGDGGRLRGTTPPVVPSASITAPSANPSRRSRAERAVALPEDWSPRSDELALARELGVDPTGEQAAFRDHHSAKGSRFVDWHAAFRVWLHRAEEFSRGRGGGASARNLSFFDVIDHRAREDGPQAARVIEVESAVSAPAPQVMTGDRAGAAELAESMRALGYTRGHA